MIKIKKKKKQIIRHFTWTKRVCYEMFLLYKKEKWCLSQKVLKYMSLLVLKENGCSPVWFGNRNCGMHYELWILRNYNISNMD